MGNRRWRSFARWVSLALPLMIAFGGLPTQLSAAAGEAANLLELGSPPPLPKPLPLPDDPVSDGGSVGVLPGSGGATPNGGYSYTIPLAVPAGRVGMQPRLALSYSSSAGDSPAGLGWSVSGLSSITRCQRTFAQDGGVSGITFDKNVDKFCLDGVRLVQVGSVGGTSAPYGGDGAEYRTETDRFAQIVSSGPAATIDAGPDNFVVRSKDGRVLRYDAFTANQVTSAVTVSGGSLAPSATTARKVVWLLTSEKDRSDNEIRYEYLQPVAGEATFLPQAIRYTFGPGQDAYRKVEFVYADRAVEDRPVTFQGGVRATLTKRLDLVKMWAPNPAVSTMVWYYDLDQQLSASKRTMLRSVRQCGYLGTCTQAKKFTYGDPAGPTFTDKLVASNENLSWGTDDKPQVQILDFNGDGASDVLYSRGQVPFQPPGALAPHFVRLGARQETGAVPLATRYDDSGLITGSQPVWRMRASDIDSDGTTEVGIPITLGGLPPTYTTWFYRWDETQHAFVASGQQPGGHYTELADMNGDGRVDVLPIQSNPSGTAFGFSVKLNTGSGFTSAPQSQYFDYGCPVRFVDLDGDGRQELVGNPRMPLQDLPIDLDEEEGIESWPGKQRGAPRPTHPSLDLRCKNGSETYRLMLDGSGELVVQPGFSTQAGVRAYRVPPMDMATQTTALGDFNGDGLIDALLAPRFGGNARVVFNTGDGLVAGPTTYVPSGGTSAGGQVEQPDLRVADFNADGRADIMAFSDGGMLLKLASADGTFRDSTIPPGNNHTGVLVKDLGRPMTQLGDFNADGRVDLLRWTVLGEIRILEQSSDWAADLAYASTDRMVEVADDGAALPIESIDYSMTWTEHPEKFADYPCSYPLVCVRAGLAVVRQTKSYAHLSSAASAPGAYVLRYTYEDPVVNVRGRGPLGFGTFRVWDSQRPAETVTTFQNRSYLDEYYGKVGLPKIVQTVVPILTQDQAAQKPPTSNARVTRVLNNFELRKLNGGKTYAVFQPDSVTNEWEEQVSIKWDSLIGTSKTEHISDVETAPSTVLRNSTVDLTFSNDDYGNLTNRVSSTTGGVSESVVTTYDNRPTGTGNPTLWLIGMPATTSVTSTAVDGAAVTRTTENHFDALGRLDTVWVEKNNPDPSLRSTTTYQLDPDGVLRGTIVSSPPLATGQQMPDRQTRFEYDRQFGAAQPLERIYSSQVWSNHDQERYRPSVWTAKHPAYGVPLATMDINGVATVNEYDDLGRIESTETDGAGVTTTTYQARMVDNAINGATVTVTGVKAIVKTQIDKAGRTVETAVKGADGTFAASTTGYDAFGRVVTSTDPAPEGTVTMTFDSLNRVVKVLGADGKLMSFDHTFSAVVSTDPMGFQKQVVRDVNGRDSLIVDRLTKPNQPYQEIRTSYEYAPFDQLDKVVDDAGNITTLAYDTRGRRTQLVEPDRGRTDTKYFGTGEPFTETHFGSGHTTTFGYDDLGRVTSTATEDGASTFVWDTAVNGIGKPSYAESPDRIRTAHRYDAFGRPAGTDYTDYSDPLAPRFSTDLHYDNGGRLTSQELPGPAGISRFTVQHDYNGAGHLTGVRYAKPGSSALEALWEVVLRKPNGALDTATLGTGADTITVSNGYQPNTGRLTSQLATRGGTTLHQRGYGYYDNGLVKSRTDAATQPVRTEEFRYDSLSRLTGWDVVLPPVAPSTQNRVITTGYGYSAISNLTTVSRTDNGVTTTQTRGFGKADGSQPHTLTSVTGPSSQTLGYDAEGRQSTGNGRDTLYTAFDLPRTVVKGGQTTTYRYDAYGQRVKEIGPNGTTFYVPGAYERRTSASGTKHVYHLPGVEGVRAQAVYDGTTTTVSYEFTDSIGSVSTATSTTGAVTGRFYYDPFGQRINDDGTQFTGSTGDIHHGFTGHEHDDDLGLINMKGRVNDPGLQSFLTPDPLNTAGGNPYSYVDNSPLNLTDPSGYLPCGPRPPFKTAPDDCSNASGRGLFKKAAMLSDAWASTGAVGDNCNCDYRELWRDAAVATLVDFLQEVKAKNLPLPSQLFERSSPAPGELGIYYSILDNIQAIKDQCFDGICPQPKKTAAAQAIPVAGAVGIATIIGATAAGLGVAAIATTLTLAKLQRTTPTIMYHYTDLAGLVRKLLTNRINGSKDGVWGPGLYVTDMAPGAYSKKDIGKMLFLDENTSKTDFWMALDVSRYTLIGKKYIFLVTPMPMPVAGTMYSFGKTPD